MKKIWNFLKQKNNLVIAIVISIVLNLSVIIYFQHRKVVGMRESYESELKLNKALTDTMNSYQNKANEWVAEKLTMQETIKNLEKKNIKLTDVQKELMKRVKEIEKRNSVIVAALIQTNVIIDSLKLGKVEVNTTDSTITFSDSTKNFQYNIDVEHVRAVSLITLPALRFNKFELPNKQFIEFHWKTDKLGKYPISFSVTNTNDYFKTINIDSYAIPAIQQKILNPTVFQKIGQFFSMGTGKFIAGAALGGAGMWLLMK